MQGGRGFSIRQWLERGMAHLGLTGELDRATAPEKRLGELRTSPARVELDIPQLAFINVAGHGRWRGCSLRPGRLLELSPSLSQPGAASLQARGYRSLVEAAQHTRGTTPPLPRLAWWPGRIRAAGPLCRPPGRYVPVRT